MSVDDSATAGRVEATVDRFFAAVQEGDTAALQRIYSADARIWHNYDEITQTREQSLKLLGFLHRVAGPMRYTEVRREVLPDGIIQQHVVELGGAAAGFRMPAMLRIYCDAEHIHRIEEYVDPTPLNERLAESSNHERRK